MKGIKSFTFSVCQLPNNRGDLNAKKQKNSESSSTTCNIICSLKVWASELIMLQMPICDNQCAFSKRTDNFSMCARTHIVNEMCAAPRRSSDAIKVNAQKQPHTNESRKEQSETTTRKLYAHSAHIAAHQKRATVWIVFEIESQGNERLQFSFHVLFVCGKWSYSYSSTHIWEI